VLPGRCFPPAAPSLPGQEIGSWGKIRGIIKVKVSKNEKYLDKVGWIVLYPMVSISFVRKIKRGNSIFLAGVEKVRKN
jgi:hypothetical protein